MSFEYDILKNYGGVNRNNLLKVLNFDQQDSNCLDLNFSDIPWLSSPTTLLIR